MSEPDQPELFGPPAPLRPFIFRFWDPAYNQWQTLDCAATTVDQALGSAQRFLRRRIRRLKAAGFTEWVPRPPYHPSEMKLAA
jgi:hypothetical protein